MEHNKKPGHHSSPKPEKPTQPATPTPISIKQLASNLEAARTSFEANLRNSLVDGGQADVLSQRIHTLLVSLAGGRHLIDSAVFSLARELANFDSRNRGAPPCASSDAEALLQQRLDQSLALIIQLEEKSTAGQAKFDDLLRQLKDSEETLAKQTANADNLQRELSAYRRWENSETAKKRIVSLDLQVSENSKQIKQLNIQINEYQHEISRLRGENGDYRTHIQRLEKEAGQLGEATATIAELRRLLESQEAAKRDLSQDLHRAEKESKKAIEKIAELEALLETVTAPGAQAGSNAPTPEDIKRLNETIDGLRIRLQEQDELVGKYAKTIQESGGLITALDAKKRALEAEAERLRTAIAEKEQSIRVSDEGYRSAMAVVTESRLQIQGELALADQKLEESAEEIRQLTLEIAELRDADGVTSKMLAEYESARGKAEAEKLELALRLDQSENEADELKRQIAENAARVESLAKERSAAEQVLADLQTSLDAFRKLLERKPEAEPQPTTKSHPYDTKALAAECRRRHEHKQLVEAGEASIYDAISDLESEKSALVRMPEKSMGDETRLQKLDIEIERLRQQFDRFRSIKATLAEEEDTLSRMLEAAKLVCAGLPSGLIDGPLPEIPEVDLPQSSEVGAEAGIETPDAATPETGQMAESPTPETKISDIRPPEPPNNPQEKNLVLWRLSKECGMSKQAVLITTLYEIVPGQKRQHSLDTVIRSAACANLLHKFGWNEEMIQEVLEGKWRGSVQELHQADLYLRGRSKSSYSRTPRQLPWDVSTLLSMAEIAEFKKWFLTYYK